MYYKVLVFTRSLDGFTDIHVTVLTLLHDEEREADHEWFTAKMMPFEEFSNVIEEWRKERARIDRHQAAVRSEDGVSVIQRASSETSRRSGVSVHTSKSGTNASTSTTVSSTCLKAETERAELEARRATLDQTRILELEVVELMARKEKLKLDTDIAASTAKLKVFDGFGRSLQSKPEQEVTYARNGRTAELSDFLSFKHSPAEYANTGTVPKTPLQKLTGDHQQQHIASQTQPRTSRRSRQGMISDVIH